jgi:muramoyltetrapeptide carboxypeptidase
MKENFNPFESNVRKIRIISPASPPRDAPFRKALDSFKKNNIKIFLSEKARSCGITKKWPAPPDERASDFNSALRDPQTDMIICSRGGFGTADILDLIDWESFKKRKLFVLGFSDITALHLAMLKYKAGIPIAGSMLADIPSVFFSDFPGLSLEKALSGDRKPLCLNKICRLSTIKKGKAKGQIVAANLCVLSSTIGTKFMPSLKGKILLLEEINEPPHKIHRFFSHLYHAGILDDIKGLLLGIFKNCGKRAELNHVFANFAKKVSGPVVSGVKFGHIKKTIFFRLGAELSISDDVNIH